MDKIKWQKRQVYALYGGKNSDTYITQGTIDEIAKYLGVSKDIVYFYGSPANKKRKHRYELIKVKGEYEIV